MADIRPLSEALAKKAKRELFEVEERIPEDIEMLRTWILKQPHLNCRTDDQFLVTFLRGCKYSIEKAKHKLDMFCTVRTALPAIFTNRTLDNPMNLEILKLGVFVVLPKPFGGEDGPRIVVIRAGRFDASKYHMRDVLRATGVMSDICMLEDDNFVVSGQIVLLDLEGVTKDHFLQFTPVLVKQMTMLGQDASPLRQKGVHYINTPTAFETVFNLFYTFMNEKLRKRVHVHGKNWESLYQHIPKDNLPEEYGGTAGSLQQVVDDWLDKIKASQDYIKECESLVVNEKLRPGKPKTADELFGVEGTFRKLNID